MVAEDASTKKRKVDNDNQNININNQSVDIHDQNVEIDNEQLNVLINKILQEYLKHKNNNNKNGDDYEKKENKRNDDNIKNNENEKLNESSFNNCVICVDGSFIYCHKQIKHLIQKYGGDFRAGITKDTNILLVGNKEKKTHNLKNIMMQ